MSSPGLRRSNTHWPSPWWRIDRLCFGWGPSRSFAIMRHYGRVDDHDMSQIDDFLLVSCLTFKILTTTYSFRFQGCFGYFLWPPASLSPQVCWLDIIVNFLWLNQNFPTWVRWYAPKGAATDVGNERIVTAVLSHIILS